MKVSRREFLTRAGAAGAMLGSGVLLDACSNSPAQTSKAATGGSPKSGGTLVFARTQEAQTLNPMLGADNGSIWTITQIFDQLLEPGTVSRIRSRGSQSRGQQVATGSHGPSISETRHSLTGHQ
jgi:ABC-type transport system substrate-binding protein